jgi:two-component system chemotaxis response regulator CheB
MNGGSLMKPIRVLVVDDSAFMRKVISDIINNDPNMTVIGTARDGRDALKKIQELNPDVVTMDVEMPGLDGLAALEELMKISPLPVLMISSLTKRGMSSLTPSSLEMSNVDLSEEFTDMIVTQRGFQANSRIITTSDEMLQELVNLKR